MLPTIATAMEVSMSYEERRVKVAAYGSLPKSSPVLVKVPGVGGPRLLHKLAAQGLAELSAAAERDLGFPLQLASGWRHHRWTSRAQYEQVLVQRFGSVAEGVKWLGYDSPHETGLAIDIGVGGLTPSRSTRDHQRQTPLHRWLVANASRFGFHPYKLEPWHWEYPISKLAWETGKPDAKGTAMLLAAPRAEGAQHDEHSELCEDELVEPEVH